MKGSLHVLHVVTLHSADNAFGGPLRVAVNLGRETQEQGHSVTIAALSAGFASVPRDVEGVPLLSAAARQYVPRTGFAGLSNLRLLLATALRMRACDVVHLHLARDLFTAPLGLMALMLRVPVVAHPHGMLLPDRRLTARIVDRLAVGRVLRGATAVIALTDAERSPLEKVAGSRLPQLTTVRNGIPVPQSFELAREERLVLFAARLAARKRPRAFVEMAEIVLARHPETRFELHGPDEGEAGPTRELIERSGLGHRIEYRGPARHEELMAHYARAAVYVLPAVDEPVGLTVLEAAATGTPVVVTDSCGLASSIAGAGAGSVAAPSPAALAQAVIWLLDDEQRREAAGRAAREMVVGGYGLSAVAQTVLSIYAASLAHHGR